MGSVDPDISGTGVVYGDPGTDPFEVSRSIGKLYFFDNPGPKVEI